MTRDMPPQRLSGTSASRRILNVLLTCRSRARAGRCFVARPLSAWLLARTECLNREVKAELFALELGRPLADRGAQPIICQRQLSHRYHVLWVRPRQQDDAGLF